jgi:hypothetical protein
VTLPEVVTGELAGKFGEISPFNHHADFELDVSMGHHMRAGCSAIAGGPLTS